MTIISDYGKQLTYDQFKTGNPITSGNLLKMGGAVNKCINTSGSIHSFGVQSNPMPVNVDVKGSLPIYLNTQTSGFHIKEVVLTIPYSAAGGSDTTISMKHYDFQNNLLGTIATYSYNDTIQGAFLRVIYDESGAIVDVESFGTWSHNNLVLPSFGFYVRESLRFDAVVNTAQVTNFGIQVRVGV